MAAMILDTFMFDDEFDMLRCRLYELEGLVDRHVVAEANHTFTGLPKPYHLSEAIDRGEFADWPIEVVRVDNAEPEAAEIGPWVKPGTERAWSREAQQRNSLDEAVYGAGPDDLVICGDVDEIPRRSVVERFFGGARCLVLAHLVYSVHHSQASEPDVPLNWAGPFIAFRRDIRQRTSYDIRNSRSFFRPLYNGGWHLSWFGDPEDRLRKRAHFSHQELRYRDELATEAPAAGLHVDGRPLTRWWGDVPRWVADGLAPEIWSKDWEAS